MQGMPAGGSAFGDMQQPPAAMYMQQSIQPAQRIVINTTTQGSDGNPVPMQRNVTIYINENS